MGEVLAGPGSFRASLGSWPAFMRSPTFQGIVVFAKPYLWTGGVLFAVDRLERRPFELKKLAKRTAFVGTVVLTLQLLWGALRAPAADRAPAAARPAPPPRQAPPSPYKEEIEPELPPERPPYGPEDEPPEDYMNYPRLKPIPTERPPGQGPVPEDWV